ncbi:amidohydrolase family protein [Salipiger pacificus]|nr:amidohydrolase family protein [Alloyangia pacifica]MCA0943874.1 amidohydrolase family protein [Alloyangia pacifica]
MLKSMNQPFIAAVIACSAASGAQAQSSVEATGATRTLITNVDVFDGVDETLIENASVLIEGNLISAVSTEPVDSEGATVIDGAGHTLIPGLIDAHWHVTYCCAPQSVVITGDVLEVAIRGALGAEETLLRGFTTVRDTGGNSFSIKKMIDAGELVGPRILPSGPPITQAGGHTDYRPYQAVPSNPGDSLWYWYANGVMLQADGVPEVILRTREVMRMGASQIKISAGGGVSSLYDPLDVRQYTKAELEAFVEVADTYNTYVMAHIFTNEAAQIALEAGVKSIEHGNLLNEETLRMIKEKDAWLSVQPILNDEDAIQFADPVSTAKFEQVTEGTINSIRMAKDMGVNIAFGTDMLFDPVLSRKQAEFVAKMKLWFTPAEVMELVTSNNAKLLELAGPRHPYQQGPLGVIEPGAYADLILVDGNPLEDIDLVADPEGNFNLIMKDGVIFKNTLAE